MKKLLIAVSLLSAVSLTGCNDDTEKAFIGTWQGEGHGFMMHLPSENYHLNISKNGNSFLIDMSIKENDNSIVHRNYIAKLENNILITGDGLDQDKLSIDEKTGELVNTFIEHINYKKISDGN